MNFIELVRERVVVFDGGMGTAIQNYELSVEDDYRGKEGCTEILVLSRPDVIKEIHASFFEVGSDVVETDTFGANHVVFAEYDLVPETFEINKRAAEIAREVAADYSTPDRPRFVSGSIGPGTKLPSLGHTDFATLERSYTEQAAGLLAGGADLFQIETCQDLLQTKSAIAGVTNAMAQAGRRIPVIAQVTIEQTGTMLVGTEIGAALVALEPFDIDVIGINCATGPTEMVEHVRHLSEHSPKLISVLPNAGLPRLEGKQTVYDLTPDELARWHTTFVDDYGVNIVGGCCGTTPEHLGAVVEAVGSRPAPERERRPWEPSIASLYSPVTLHQDTSFLVMGERANAQGSKKFRDLIEADDWEGMVNVGKEQVKEGAHLIDVCIDFTGRDGAADMDEITARLSTASTLPIMLDSTEWQVISAGLNRIGGRAVINSVNLEDGPEGRPGHLFPLARKFAAAVVCLCIDEEGQARDIDWKLRVAHQIKDLAHEHGLRNEDLIFDALTFPLTTGQEELRADGIATLEAIRRIKDEIPGSFTTLGVSNVSFGLKPAARQVLNSMFLHEAIGYGLDSAIVNAKKILPLHKIDEEHKRICLDLIYNRRGTQGGAGDDAAYDPLKALLAAFEDVTTTTATVDELEGLSNPERLKRRIIDGLREGLTEDLDIALEEREALDIVNTTLLAGMAVVGELFASGEMQLPFVLESAETMKTAVAHLEPHMDRVEGQAKGKVVLATVKGDVHDIGKNLVDIILSNNGFEVHNIGIKQPLTPMLEKAREVDADAIGMSGLLVKSTLIMRENLEELNELGIHDEFPILLGGAALTRKYVEHDLREIFNGRVFYGKDAFEGLGTVDKLSSGAFDQDWGRVSSGRTPAAADIEADDAPIEISTRRADVDADNEVFVPPFVGSRVIKGIAIADVAKWLNETALFRNQWRIVPGKQSAQDYEQMLDDEARPALRELLARAEAEKILAPTVVYGYWPANADDNDVVLYDPDGSGREIARLAFPRQPDGRELCIADFLRPAASGEIDYVGLMLATVGQKATDVAHELFENNDYKDYLYLHGLSVEMAEATAEYWHRRMREEWGFLEAGEPDLASIFRQGYRGGRYSWGYPACPDLEEQTTVAKLLEPERIGVTLTDEFQWDPEQTTAAIVCHHPDAKYFVVRDARTGKLLRA